MAGERLRVVSGSIAGQTIALDGELVLGRSERGPGRLNTQHVMSIGSAGKLNELPGSPTKLPVPSSANPQGLAVIPGPDAPRR